MFGNAFRFPNLYESEYYDDLSNFRISRDLARERITTYEAEGSLQMTDQLSGLATVYTYAMRNLIDQVSNPVDSSLQFQNVQKVQALGCEAELTARWKNGINTYVSYVYENVRDKALSERLTNSPLHFVKCGCQIPLAGIVRASFEVRYESARMTVMGASTRPFWLTNVSFVTLRSGGNRTNGSGCGSWNASLLIKNLFNTPYEYPGGFEHLPIAAIAQDGREYTLRVEWEF
jgi:outer membrane receptor protein involved in Fe transport